MQEGKSDLELVTAVQNGNQEAYEELLRRYGGKAYSLASRMTRNSEDAEEVLQDVFVTVYRKIGSFEGKSSFSSWLYRVTVNAALMKLRKRRQDQTLSLEEMIPDEEASLLLRSSEEEEGDRVRERKEVLLELEQAIQKLPDDYRPVFILRDIDGLTSREVGRILNLSVPAVKSRLHRSRLMLRRRLSGFYREYQSGDAQSLSQPGSQLLVQRSFGV